MNPMGVVVILKLPQLLFQIALVPEKSLVQKLPSDRANEPLGKGMGYRHMGNSFNPINFPNPQIGSPLVVAEQGIVIRAEMAGRAFTTERGLIEHLAKRGSIDIASMNTKADDAPCKLVHDNKDPVGLEENGLAPEQIDAPEAIFHMADKGEPRGPISGILAKVFGKYPSHDVFIDVDAKSPCDFQGDPGSAELGISALHLQNKLDELW